LIWYERDCYVTWFDMLYQCFTLNMMWQCLTCYKCLTLCDNVILDTVVFDIIWHCFAWCDSVHTMWQRLICCDSVDMMWQVFNIMWQCWYVTVFDLIWQCFMWCDSIWHVIVLTWCDSDWHDVTVFDMMWQCLTWCDSVLHNVRVFDIMWLSHLRFSISMFQLSCTGPL
jgi:hypothetical protein